MKRSAEFAAQVRFTVQEGLGGGEYEKLGTGTRRIYTTCQGLVERSSERRRGLAGTLVVCIKLPSNAVGSARAQLVFIRFPPYWLCIMRIIRRDLS